MEAYLALRGCGPCPLRLAQAQASAQVLAERLAGHPAVRGVRYPGLPDDPGHRRAARTMSGFGSLISIELADAQTADALVEACRLWVFATSLGGVESSLERRRRWPAELPTVPEGLVRLSVGIEHVEDLWADLAQGFEQAELVPLVALGLGRPGHQRGDHLRRRQPPAITAATCSTIGISTWCCAASTWIEAQDLTPSAT